MSYLKDQDKPFIERIPATFSDQSKIFAEHDPLELTRARKMVAVAILQGKKICDVEQELEKHMEKVGHPDSGSQILRFREIIVGELAK